MIPTQVLMAAWLMAASLESHCRIASSGRVQRFECIVMANRSIVLSLTLDLGTHTTPIGKKEEGHRRKVELIQAIE